MKAFALTGRVELICESSITNLYKKLKLYGNISYKNQYSPDAALWLLSPHGEPRYFLRSSPPYPLAHLCRCPDGSGTQSGILGARYTNDGGYGECICRHVLSRGGCKGSGFRHNLDGYAAGHLLGRSSRPLIAFGMAALQHHPPCGYFPEAGGGRHYGTSSQRRGESVLLLPLGVYVSIYPGGQAVARSDGSRVHPCFGSPFPGYPLLRAFLHRLLV